MFFCISPFQLHCGIMGVTPYLYQVPAFMLRWNCVSIFWMSRFQWPCGITGVTTPVYIFCIFFIWSVSWMSPFWRSWTSSFWRPCGIMGDTSSVNRFLPLYLQVVLLSFECLCSGDLGCRHSGDMVESWEGLLCSDLLPFCLDDKAFLSFECLCSGDLECHNSGDMVRSQ